MLHAIERGVERRDDAFAFDAEHGVRHALVLERSRLDPSAERLALGRGNDED
ncbi:hypothetical protein D3C83_326780 [compost metagenome]